MPSSEDENNSQRFSLRAFLRGLPIPRKLTRIVPRLALVLSRRNRRRGKQKIQALNAGLEKRAADLEAANRELEAFSYSVSHDLRAPLRVMAGYSEILLESQRERLHDDGLRMLTYLRDTAWRMDQLVDDLLKLARIHRGGLQRGRVDLSALAAQVIEELKMREPARRVDVVVQSNLWVDADGRLLRIVLDNLLGNAWKFTARTPQARIEMRAERHGEEETIVVCDNGVGFDIRHARRLFLPFQRFHSQEHYPGTGIGLATARRVIDRHGGRIWCHSEPGRGALFYFTLSGSEDKSAC